MIQVHLNQKSANLRFEDRMNGVFFSRVNLLHGADLPAQNHVQIAIVDRSACHCIRLVVLRHEAEVQRLPSGCIQIVRALLGSHDRLPQPADLP